MENTAQETEVLTDEGQSQVVEQTEELDGGNLPSSVEENSSNLDKFQLSDEFVSKHFKNGKLYGRFDSLEAVLNTLQAVETKHSNLVRDMKSGKIEQSEPVVETPIVEVAQPIIQKFVANDFSYDGLDSDIQELSQQTGKSVAEIKLAALEMKEQISKAYSVVGGKEEYNAMLDWAKSSLSDSAKTDFDKSLTTGLGEYAIKGLYNDYKMSSGTEPQQARRIEGDGSGNVGVRGYGSLQEIARDKAYLESRQGRSDSAAQQMYQRRMSLTPDSVIYGR